WHRPGIAVVLERRVDQPDDRKEDEDEDHYSHEIGEDADEEFADAGAPTLRRRRVRAPFVRRDDCHSSPPWNQHSWLERIRFVTRPASARFSGTGTDSRG